MSAFNAFTYYRSMNLESVLELPHIQSAKNSPAEASIYIGRKWKCLSTKDKNRYKELAEKANKKAAKENKEKRVKITSQKKKKKSTKKSKKNSLTKRDKTPINRDSQKKPMQDRSEIINYNRKNTRKENLTNWLNRIAPYFSEEYFDVLNDAGYDSIITFRGNIKLSSLLNLGIKERHAEMILEKASLLN